MFCPWETWCGLGNTKLSASRMSKEAGSPGERALAQATQPLAVAPPCRPPVANRDSSTSGCPSGDRVKWQTGPLATALTCRAPDGAWEMSASGRASISAAPPCLSAGGWEVPRWLVGGPPVSTDAVRKSHALRFSVDDVCVSAPLGVVNEGSATLCLVSSSRGVDSCSTIDVIRRNSLGAGGGTKDRTRSAHFSKTAETFPRAARCSSLAHLRRMASACSSMLPPSCRTMRRASDISA
mmetsp:Transcript_29818/g.79284  ORF Transcript_29818/g.79284 Transcript_29818/m.79284 type:complete len:238 (-) Transcript_29818:814-1527(-)